MSVRGDIGHNVQGTMSAVIEKLFFHCNSVDAVRTRTQLCSLKIHTESDSGDGAHGAYPNLPLSILLFRKLSHFMN